MIEIGLNQVMKNYGYRPVLSGASFEVMSGQRAAIVGRNGTGKTTLLRLIAGMESPDSGKVSLRRGATLGFLEQIPHLRQPGWTVRQVLLEPYAGLLALEQSLRDMEAEMASPGGNLDALMARYAAKEEEYALSGGYDMEERTSKVVQGFRLGELLDREYNVLSGGQKTVMDLAAAVLRQPDILLLDEPTNHLDVETLEWFEGFLAKYRGTVVMVSHDRWFLDRVATHTILLDEGKCIPFVGNYSHSMEERELQLMAEFEQYRNQQKKIEAMRAAIKRFRHWGALNKQNKTFYRKAKELEKRLEKMEQLDRPQLEKPKLDIHFAGARTGSEVLWLRDFSLAFGEQVLLEKAELLVREKDRLCLLGGNGTGKTSLLRAVLGEGPYQGELGLNPGVRLGYIPQEIRFLPETDTLLEAFRRKVPGTEGQARALLAKYGFLGEDVFKRVSGLSGGEKVLLKLAILMQDQVNLLILDEPTNHIDIETREMLEEALLDYTGTLFFVSHDRYFIAKTATRMARLQDRRLWTFDGGYQALLDFEARVAQN